MGLCPPLSPDGDISPARGEMGTSGDLHFMSGELKVRKFLLDTMRYIRTRPPNRTVVDLFRTSITIKMDPRHKAEDDY